MAMDGGQIDVVLATIDKISKATRAAWKRLAKADQTDADAIVEQLKDLLDSLDKILCIAD